MMCNPAWSVAGPGAPGPSFWQGRSGRTYLLVAEAFDRFALDDAGVYALAAEDRLVWAGSLADVVGDVASRARFRRALAMASEAFRLPERLDPSERFSIGWDLQGATPAAARPAA